MITFSSSSSSNLKLQRSLQRLFMWNIFIGWPCSIIFIKTTRFPAFVYISLIGDKFSLMKFFACLNCMFFYFSRLFYSSLDWENDWKFSLNFSVWLTNSVAVFKISWLHSDFNIRTNKYHCGLKLVLCSSIRNTR